MSAVCTSTVEEWRSSLLLPRMKRSADEIPPQGGESPSKKARSDDDSGATLGTPPVPALDKPWRFLTCGEDGASYSGYKWQPPSLEMAALMHASFFVCYARAKAARKRQRERRPGEQLWFQRVLDVQDQLWFQKVLEWAREGDAALLEDTEKLEIATALFPLPEGKTHADVGTFTRAEIDFHDGPTYIYEDWC